MSFYDDIEDNKIWKTWWSNSTSADAEKHNIRYFKIIDGKVIYIIDPEEWTLAEAEQ